MATVSIGNVCSIASDTFRPIHTGAVDAVGELVEKLSALNDGEGLSFSADGIKWTTLQQSIRLSAFQKGFAVSFRKGDPCRVYRMRLKPTRGTSKDRNVEIAESVLSGDTQTSVANRFGLSRERVRQICEHEKFSSFPVSERIAKVDEFAGPYLEAVLETPLCMLCGSKGSTNLMRGVCKDCGNSIRVLRIAASNIRAFKSTGDRHYLAMAMWTIRRHNLKPEDLAKH
jgi:hypothetical protein